MRVQDNCNISSSTESKDSEGQGAVPTPTSRFQSCRNGERVYKVVRVCAMRDKKLTISVLVTGGLRLGIIIARDTTPGQAAIDVQHFSQFLDEYPQPVLCRTRSLAAESVRGARLV